MRHPIRVLGESAYPDHAPAVRVRLAAFQSYLAQEGVALSYRSSLTNAEYAMLSQDGNLSHKTAAILRSLGRASTSRLDKYELYLVHRLRTLVPFWTIDPPRRVDVYDFDDALFLSAGAGSVSLRRLKQQAQRWRKYVKCARLVLAGNAYLADHCLPYTKNVEIFPSCIEPRRYRVREHIDKQILVAGWIGSRTTIGYLTPWLPVFDRVNSAGVHWKLMVVGADTGVRRPWLIHRPWLPNREAEMLAEFDVGIMPLPDTAWTQGKCGYKLLQYFAAGIPAIASPIGVNRQLVREEHGWLANDYAGWCSVLTGPARDSELRAAAGAQARSFVETEFSYQRWSPELAGALKALAG